jgi:hypothetical protein
VAFALDNEGVEEAPLIWFHAGHAGVGDHVDIRQARGLRPEGLRPAGTLAGQYRGNGLR